MTSDTRSRVRRLLPVVALALALVAAGALLGWRGSGHAGFDQRAQQLSARWDAEERQGLDPARAAPLRRDLVALQAEQSGWWWRPWQSTEASPALDRLSARASSVWQGAIATTRSGATASLTAATALVREQARWLPPQLGAGIPGWQRRLAVASTPAAYAALAHEVGAATDVARQRAAAARAATVPTSPPALLAAARGLLARADAAHLDAGTVPALTGRLDQAVSAAADPAAAMAQLSSALPDLQTLVGVNDEVAGRLDSLLASVGQARGERTPGAAAAWSRYQALQAAFVGARTLDQVTAVEPETGALEQAVAADLAANRCGHPVPGGRVITLDLTAQEMVFYEDGCAVRATVVTTGRPALPTPTGSFAVFARFSPYVFHSPWPPGSPYWYPTSPVGYAMEFAQGGYFLHDAPWEPDSQMGPGSEDGGGASHGCVHLPAQVMAWAYSWASIGTPVIVSS